MNITQRWLRGIKWSLVVLLLSGLELYAGSPSDGVESHFKPTPALDGTLDQANARVREWLLAGFGSIATDLQRLANDKSLNADAIARFSLRLKKGESLGIPVDSAITNAQGAIRDMEAFLQNPRINKETRQQTELNIAAAQQQIDLLVLNQQRVEVAKQQLSELGKACDYWQQFWTVTIRAAGPDQTRRQLKELIEQERARLERWMKDGKGLGG